MLFGDRLRKLRSEMKITQKQLALHFKISESAVGMYERNEREPSFEMINKLADYFDVSVDYLTGHSDNKTHKENSARKVYFYGGAEDITPEEKEALDEVVEFELRRLRRAKDRVEKAYEGDKEFKRSRNRLGED